MSTKTYSPSDWMITALGAVAVGFKDGTFIKVTRNAATTKMTAGARGDIVVTAMLDRSGKVEVTLQRESPTNNVWSAWLTSFERATNAADRAALMQLGFFAKNLNGPTLAGGANCTIEKHPDMEGASDASGITWTFLVDDLSMFNGGAVA